MGWDARGYMRQYWGILRDFKRCVYCSCGDHRRAGVPYSLSQGERSAVCMQQLLGGRKGGSQMRHHVQAQMVLGVCTFLPVFPSPVLSLLFQQHGYIHLCLWPAYTALAVVWALSMCWACLPSPRVLPNNINYFLDLYQATVHKVFSFLIFWAWSIDTLLSLHINSLLHWNSFFYPVKGFGNQRSRILEKPIFADASVLHALRAFKHRRAPLLMAAQLSILEGPAISHLQRAEPACNTTHLICFHVYSQGWSLC